MPSRIFLHKYGPSTSAMQVREELRKLGHNVRYIQPHPRTDVVLNWGSAREIPFLRTVLNNPRSVRTATSKRASYRVFEAAGIPTCEITTSRDIATDWGRTQRIIGRNADHGSGGAGIVVYEEGTPIGEHRFYVKYFRKQREFRLHIYKGIVLRILEKLKRRGFEQRDPYIRSHLRGWVFASNHLLNNPCPPEVLELGVLAVHSLGLDFGGVDIGWNTNRNRGIVFEVNTAPGLEGSTPQLYANAIHNDVG